MAELDQINVSTRRYIRETPSLVDAVFQNDPLWAYLRANVPEEFDGGRRIDEGFIYNGLIGGPYRKGKSFNTSQRQIEQNLQFDPKFFEIGVTLYKEDVQVLNKGGNAAFRLIDSRMQAAYMTVGAHQAIGLYMNDTTAGYEANWEGLAAALNDNSTNSWDGQTYSTYGTITRGGEVGTALNSVPTDVSGVIEYNTLEETFSAACFGSIEPNVGVSTSLGFSYIREKFQTQQRFNNTTEANIGFRGMEFQGATLMKSRYAPGSAISASSDPVAVTFMEQMSNEVVGAYPTVTAETLWWINARKPYACLYVSTDPEYSYGFTGFKPAQGNTSIVGQVLYGGAVTFQPRYHAQLYGITG
jgi:hypothetical protein